ncbi:MULTISPECIES: aldose 1-epimerase family protein [unclassified Flavobacterium]|uniref:aldose 1-epimerase family protein n=1 Tax=unclassified Flavobacterium TaxID=196869 RepID=UPI003F92DD78
MTTTIANATLSATIKHAGAELCSLKKKSTNKEYIWEGNPEFWGKHSPILFPIVGTLKDNTFTYNDTPYHLSRHGFARDMVFTLIDSQDDSATFSLQANQETLKVFPFEFELQIKYTLTENALAISYKVKNKDTSKMAFSIGAHPAFSLRENFEDYSLQFENNEKLEYTLLENNLISTETATLTTTEGIVNLNYQLFEKDALIFKSLESKSITILENKKPLLAVEFEGFPHLGIWTPKDAPFLCIEPWFGYSDAVDSNGNIFEKDGIQILESSASFNSKFSISIL